MNKNIISGLIVSFVLGVILGFSAGFFFPHDISLKSGKSMTESDTAAYTLITDNLRAFSRPDTVKLKSGTYDASTNTLYATTAAMNKMGQELYDVVIFSDDGLEILDYFSERSDSEIQKFTALAKSEDDLNYEAINKKLAELYE